MIQAALFAALFAASASAELVRMEPSVNTFSSSKWLQESNKNQRKLEEKISMMFVLKHDKLAIKEFEKKLLDISTPRSPNYGKWMTKEQVVEAISPKAEAVDTVLQYLHNFGVNATKVNKYNDIIKVTMNVELAEKVLSTEFSKFRSVSERNVAIYRITKPYFLPEEIASHVSIVDDIMRFPTLKTPIMTYGAEDTAGSEFAACGADCNGFTTPAVLQSRYGFPTVSSATSGNSMSVAEFQFQYYDQKDLTAFSNACDVTVSVEDVQGGNNEKLCERGGCVESLLDIEYIDAIAHPIPLEVIYSGDYSLFDWVNTVMDSDSPPLVNSVSYGNDEIQQTSNEYMEECNTQFMKAGAMGISILFASGDQGVWGRTGASKTGTYNPDFPAGSPYITAVGGTNFQTKSEIGTESAWDCGGGGFSNEFDTPSWQADAVSAYFATASAAGVLPDAKLYNAGGRGYPDLAALGGQTNPYCVSHAGGSFSGVAGTSASCPVVAGIFASINNERLAAGKPSLGWLNPFIYANPQCFNDVNDGTMNNCYKGYSGFAALNGWDPATGMGTPIYSCLSAAAAAI